MVVAVGTVSSPVVIATSDVVARDAAAGVLEMGAAGGDVLLSEVIIGSADVDAAG